MINRVMGKKVEKNYYADTHSKEIHENGITRYEFEGKPEVKCDTKDLEWAEICHYDGDEKHNDKFSWLSTTNKINISEHVEVAIDKTVLRADLGEVFLYTDHVVEETEKNKEEAEIFCAKITKKFNTAMIKADEKMKAYCDLHKLRYEDTDACDLWKIVYDTPYIIKNGKMTSKNDTIITASINTISNCFNENISATISDIKY